MLKLKETVDRVLEGVLVVLMAVLVVDVLWQVFSRYILNNPSSFTEELARFLLIWVGLLGAAYVSSKNMHLAVDLLPTRLTGRRRLYLELFIQGSILVFALSVMVVGGARLVWTTLYLGQMAAALLMPLGYVYVVLPLSGLLIAFYCVLLIIDTVRALQGKAPLLIDHGTDDMQTPPAID